jgi:YesN/AraC family two-component response regulator
MQQTTENSGEFSILLVEDEEIARGSLSRMLAMKFPEATLYTAENGRIGLELFREHQPELVITDINMPQLNGIQMAGAIRASHPRAQIIFLSAHSEAKFLREAEATGTPHYVMKPVDRHELFSVIGNCLQQMNA